MISTKVKIANKALSLDITERKQAEERAKLFSQAVEGAIDAIAITDMNGVITYANSAMEEMYGYEKGELIGKPVFDLNPNSEMVNEIMSSLIKTGSWNGEIESIKKNKEIFPVLLSLSMARDDKGKAIAMMGASRDITTYKRMLEVLRRSKEKYEELAQSITDVFFAFDKDLRYTYWNKASEELTGIPAKDALGKHLYDVFPRDEQTREAEEAYLKVLRTKKPQHFINEYKLGDKDYFFAISAYSSKGGVSVFVKDITEPKRMERELQERNEQLMIQQQELIEKTREVERANHLKSEFLANMSHELRTPLNVIIGFSELMADEVPGKINGEQRQCFNDILDSSHHLLNLINGVLDLSRIESGKVEVKTSDIALTEVIESLSRTLMPILTPREQSLDIEVEEGLPLLHTDKAKLRQVLLNLADNASKFTPDGGRLKIEAVRNGDWCRVSMIDNGIGIKEEDQERIFEPFCRLDSPLAGERGGTGLGLALVKQIVERYGGQVCVESEYEKGSRFTFTVPLATNGKSNPLGRNKR